MAVRKNAAGFFYLGASSKIQKYLLQILKRRKVSITLPFHYINKAHHFINFYFVKPV